MAPVRLAEQAHSIPGTLGARTALEAALYRAGRHEDPHPDDIAYTARTLSALYRAGRHEDPRLGPSEVRPSGLFFRAMLAFRLGKVSEAHQALEAARRRAAEVEDKLSTPWTERVELRLLRQEAEKLIGAPKP
jgi:hypothetical protein